MMEGHASACLEITSKSFSRIEDENENENENEDEDEEEKHLQLKLEGQASRRDGVHPCTSSSARLSRSFALQIDQLPLCT